MADIRPIFCPFCGFEMFTDYEIMLHIETLHPEDGVSPFVVQENNSLSTLSANDVDSETSVSYHMKKTEDKLSIDADNRSDLLQQDKDILQHLNQGQTNSDVAAKSELNTVATSAKNYDEDQEEIVFKPRILRKRGTKNKAMQNSYVKISQSSSLSESSLQGGHRRLGKSELGPHAHEAKMPGWLIKLLREEDGATKIVKRVQNGKLKEKEICPNMLAGVIPVLIRLLSEDKSTLYAYTCHPSVKHVSRLKREDGFCGYRNIQMMTSYIVSTESQGCEVLGNKIPTIFDIQDFIEMAWDLGVNSHGRIETNGIRETRKYIGTSEAQAMFNGLGIPCEVQGITKCKTTDKPAYEILLKTTEDYFSHDSADMERKVRCTHLPPIYFQHQGHSMTIVGFEKKNDGSKNLIVFDPRYYDSSKIIDLVDRATSVNVRPENLLGAYRRGISYLKKFNEFEILNLRCLSSDSRATARISDLSKF